VRTSRSPIFASEPVGFEAPFPNSYGRGLNLDYSHNSWKKVDKSSGFIVSKLLEEESEGDIESSDLEVISNNSDEEKPMPSTMLKNIREAGPVPQKHTLGGLLHKLDSINLTGGSPHSRNSDANNSARAFEAKVNFLNSIGSGPWPNQN
jgi:hypothetical protein